MKGGVTMPDITGNIDFNITFRNRHPKLSLEWYVKGKYFVEVYISLWWFSFSITLNGSYIPNQKEDARGKPET
jgi:hypothetical protein